MSGSSAKAAITIQWLSSGLFQAHGWRHCPPGESQVFDIEMSPNPMNRRALDTLLAASVSGASPPFSEVGSAHESTTPLRANFALTRSDPPAGATVCNVTGVRCREYCRRIRPRSDSGFHRAVVVPRHTTQGSPHPRSRKGA